MSIQLEPGDLLFRWIQEKEKEECIPLGVTIAQRKSHEKQTWKLMHLGADRYHELKKYIPDYQFAQEIGHVGIYDGKKNVTEVGAWGLVSNKPRKRKRDLTDLVVRFDDKGIRKKICNIACECLKTKKKYLYPLHKVFTEEHTKNKILVGTKKVAWSKAESKANGSWSRMSKDPINPCLSYKMQREKEVFIKNCQHLQEIEKKIPKEKKEKFKIGLGKCQPVCSHFVHAVIYASVFEGTTVWAATLPETETIFNVSPNMLWHYFLNRLGVFYGVETTLIGVQYDGKFQKEKTETFLATHKNRINWQHQHSLKKHISLM